MEKSGLLPLIAQAAKKSDLSISAVSLWETATLIYRGQITISGNTTEWFKEALKAPGISVIPLSAEIAIESTSLPGKFHGDPADQIIVATARLYKATLISMDEKIGHYGESGLLKVISKSKSSRGNTHRILANRTSLIQ